MANQKIEPKKQSDRRKAGYDVLGTLTGTDNPEKTANAMEARHGALGSFAVDHVLGNLWSRPQLSRRDRSLIVVTFLATIGAEEELGAHIEGAIRHGLSREEVEEIINQVAGYAGFPMAMQAARLVAEAWCKADGVDRLPPRPLAKPMDDNARWDKASDVMSTLFAGRTASDPQEARANIVDQLGGVGEMAFDFGFGELWSRDQLSRRDRSMVTVALLAILSRLDELAIHAPAALNHGCTEAEIEEIMVQLTVYGGFPRAVEGIRAVRAAFAKRAARAANNE
ncbi:MAG: carboxymuconolactone decarboxylase family protein [Pseudomonadales bacterium]|nr:carboxymuconolactone decarboxylase family protein [Pseudomonadales bacterium]